MKTDPFLYQHINLTEKILDKAPPAEDDGTDEESLKVDDAARISADGQKERIMSRVIERITSDSDDD